MCTFTSNLAFEIVGFCVHHVLPRIVGFRQFERQQQGASVIVGSIHQRDVGQSTWSSVIVDVVDGRDGCLCQFGQVNVSFQVVNGHGDEQLHTGLNQAGHTIGKHTPARDEQRRGQGEFNRIGSLVNPLLVEGETATSIRVVAKGSIGKREVFNGYVRNPHGVGGEVFDGGWLPHHIDGCTVVIGVIVSHQGGDAWRCAALANDVLEGRGDVEQHLFGVAVKPYVVGHDTNGVFLSVNEGHAIQ